jgi:hypothetical protein
LGNRLFLHFLLISCLSASIFFEYASAETKPISSGEWFPNLIFEDSLPKETRAYLGISRKTSFSFNDIRGTILIIELFSTYCTSCPKNIPSLNTIYSYIENDPGLKGKIKVIGIAIGNNQNEVKHYMKQYKVLYPLLTDFNFNAHRALGNPRVPYTIFVKKSVRGKAIVFNTHQGIIESVNSIMDQVKVEISE